jgi:hypothetical protein
LLVKAKATRKTRTKEPRVKRPAMPKFFVVDEEMKHRASLLEGELRQWPEVKSKPMFGMAAFFRKNLIFAAVPKTRTLHSPQSITMKFDSMPIALCEKLSAEPRLTRDAPGPGAGWHAFELGSTEDIRDALWWLNQAYELAAARSVAPRKSASGGQSRWSSGSRRR